MNNEKALWQTQTYSSGPSSLALDNFPLTEVVLRTSRNLLVSFLPSLCFKTKSSWHMSASLHFLLMMQPVQEMATRVHRGSPGFTLCYLSAMLMSICVTLNRAIASFSYTNKQLASARSCSTWLFLIPHSPMLPLFRYTSSPRISTQLFSLIKMPKPGISKYSLLLLPLVTLHRWRLSPYPWGHHELQKQGPGKSELDLNALSFGLALVIPKWSMHAFKEGEEKSAVLHGNDACESQYHIYQPSTISLQVQ